MVSCRRCGRTLTYPRSISHGCGSFCYYKKGCLPVNKLKGLAGHQEEGKSGQWKPLTRALLIGVAMGVSCTLMHLACLAVAFIEKHEFLFKGASLLYEGIKSGHPHDKSSSTLITESGSIAFNRFSRSERDSVSKYVGKQISDYVGRHNVSERVSQSIAEETVNKVISSGGSMVFDWGSRILMR